MTVSVVTRTTIRCVFNGGWIEHTTGHAHPLFTIKKNTVARGEGVEINFTCDTLPELIEALQELQRQVEALKK